MPNVPCPQCGVPVTEGTICRFHTEVLGAGGCWDPTWSDGNRAFCDFIHRGILQVRDPRSEPKLWHVDDPATMGPGPTEDAR